jgi:two-component system NtrC family sensor kinase
MRLRERLFGRVRQTLRYQLVVYILLPVFIAAALAIGVTGYWFFDFTQDNLMRKVRGDAYLAQYALRQVERKRYLADLQRFADSFEVRTAIARHNVSRLEQERRDFMKEHGFTFVHITGPLGRWLYEKGSGPKATSKPTLLTARALRNEPGVALEVFNRDDLAREGPTVLARVEELKETGQDWIPQGLVLRAVVPIRNAQGKIFAALDGGVLFNGRSEILKAVREQVYRTGTLPANSLGLVGIALDDVRIDSSGTSGAKPDVFFGTRVRDQIRDAVVGAGRVVVARDSVGGRTYLSAYAPVYDVHAQGVGMLQVGFDEAPFRSIYFRAVALLFLIVATVTGIATVLAFRGVRFVTTPIEKITGVVHATRTGFGRRIGPVESGREIRELARQFDAMLDLLQERDQEIRLAASELETKVEVRTRELATKNLDLERSIALLNETREQLLLNEKLAALGEMAAGIAHEINNPASVLVGNLDLMVRDLGDASEPVKQEIEVMVQQVDRIRHIVNSLLQFARPEQALGVTSRADVNQVVQDTIGLVRYAADAKALSLQVQPGATHPIRIDVYELQQVLVNLVLNAVHVLETSGSILITTRNLDNGGVGIDVRDNGPGIPSENLPRLFDPFFTTKSRGNTGLGLAVSYGIVRRHGGELSVETEPGKGTTFHIRLPADDAGADMRASEYPARSGAVSAVPTNTK